jgi:transposase-like protein
VGEPIGWLALRNASMVRRWKDVQVDSTIIFIGSQRTFTYRAIRKEGSSLVVGYRRLEWVRERQTIIHSMPHWIERGLIWERR